MLVLYFLFHFFFYEIMSLSLKKIIVIYICISWFSKCSPKRLKWYEPQETISGRPNASCIHRAKKTLCSSTSSSAYRLILRVTSSIPFFIHPTANHLQSFSIVLIILLNILQTFHDYHLQTYWYQTLYPNIWSTLYV